MVWVCEVVGEECVVDVFCECEVDDIGVVDVIEFFVSDDECCFFEVMWCGFDVGLM